MLLHTVDGWGPTVHNYFHEDLVGVKEGEPKSLMGTLVLDESQMPCDQNHEICTVVRDRFGPYHKRANSLRLLADNESVYLRSDDRKLVLRFQREISQEEFEESFYMKKAMERSLREAPNDWVHLQSLIKSNQETLDLCRSLHNRYLKDYARLLTLNLSSLLVRPFAEALLRVTTSDPTYEKAAKDAYPLFRNQARLAYESLREDNPSFKTAIEILESRIKNLKSQVQLFKSQRYGGKSPSLKAALESR